MEYNVIYTPSDMEFMHLLSKRGLDFKQSFKIINKEKELKHNKRNLINIANIFCKVSGFTIEELRTSKKHDAVWIKQLAFYYIKERTTYSNSFISEHFNVVKSSVSFGMIAVRNSLQVDNIAKDFYKLVEQQTVKTRQRS